MKNSIVNRVTLIILVIIISALFLKMISQFLMAIFMAALFSAMVHPLYRWLTKKLRGRKNMASAITIVIIVFLILIPTAFLVGIVVNEAIHIGQSITPWIESFINEPGKLSSYLEKIPYYEQILPYRNMIVEKAGQAVGTISNLLVSQLKSMTKMTVTTIFNLAIMLYTMFYFLTMGNIFLDRILYYLPLTHEDEERLLSRFTSVARATIKSTIIIGIIQGGICGLAFWLAGIQAAVFWGSIMAIMSIIPALGTALIWVPALTVLLLNGDLGGAAILILLCGGIAGNIDNLLRPRLVGRDTEMHDLFVLFGTLGGLGMFGILGIIIGPIIAALFVTIWEIYGENFKDYLPQVGSFKENSQQDENPRKEQEEQIKHEG